MDMACLDSPGVGLGVWSSGRAPGLQYSIPDTKKLRRVEILGDPGYKLMRLDFSAGCWGGIFEAF